MTTLTYEQYTRVSDVLAKARGIVAVVRCAGLSKDDATPAEVANALWAAEDFLSEVDAILEAAGKEGKR